MTSKSKNLLNAKVDQLKSRKHFALYLGNDVKKELSIDTSKDMENFSHYAKIEIDNMLDYNKKIEIFTIILIIGLYLTGLAIILCGIIIWKNPAVTASGTITGLGISITWPIKKLLDLRDSNIHLQKFVLLIPLLSPDDAGDKAEKILFGKY